MGAVHLLLLVAYGAQQAPLETKSTQTGAAPASVAPEAAAIEQTKGWGDAPPPSTQDPAARLRLTLERITAGALVVLTREGEGGKKIEKLIPEALWANPPVLIDIPPNERWTLVATAPGYEKLVREVVFPEGASAMTIRVELRKLRP
jgi:hypothetical protein